MVTESRPPRIGENYRMQVGSTDRIIEVTVTSVTDSQVSVETIPEKVSMGLGAWYLSLAQGTISIDLK